MEITDHSEFMPKLFGDDASSHQFDSVPPHTIISLFIYLSFELFINYTDV